MSATVVVQVRVAIITRCRDRGVFDTLQAGGAIDLFFCEEPEEVSNDCVAVVIDGENLSVDEVARLVMILLAMRVNGQRLMLTILAGPGNEAQLMPFRGRGARVHPSGESLELLAEALRYHNAELMPDSWK